MNQPAIVYIYMRAFSYCANPHLYEALDQLPLVGFEAFRDITLGDVFSLASNKYHAASKEMLKRSCPRLIKQVLFALAKLAGEDVSWRSDLSQTIKKVAASIARLRCGEDRLKKELAKLPFLPPDFHLALLDDGGVFGVVSRCHTSGQKTVPSNPELDSVRAYRMQSILKALDCKDAAICPLHRGVVPHHVQFDQTAVRAIITSLRKMVRRAADESKLVDVDVAIESAGAGARPSGLVTDSLANRTLQRLLVKHAGKIEALAKELAGNDEVNIARVWRTILSKSIHNNKWLVRTLDTDGVSVSVYRERVSDAEELPASRHVILVPKPKQKRAANASAGHASATGGDADGDGNADGDDNTDGNGNADGGGDAGAGVRIAPKKPRPGKGYTKAMREFAVLDSTVKTALDALSVAISDFGLFYSDVVQASHDMSEQCLEAYRAACERLREAFEGVVLFPKLYSRRKQRSLCNQMQSLIDPVNAVQAGAITFEIHDAIAEFASEKLLHQQQLVAADPNVLDTFFCDGFGQDHVRRYLRLTARCLETGRGTLMHRYSQRYIDETPLCELFPDEVTRASNYYATICKFFYCF